MGVRGQLVTTACKLTFPEFECFVESSFGLHYFKQSNCSFFIFSSSVFFVFSGWNRLAEICIWSFGKVLTKVTWDRVSFHQQTNFPHSVVTYFHSYSPDNLSLFFPLPLQMFKLLLKSHIHHETKATMLHSSILFYMHDGPGIVQCTCTPWSFLDRVLSIFPACPTWKLPSFPSSPGSKNALTLCFCISQL